MNEIQKLIDAQNYEPQMEEILAREFIRNYIIKNPDYLVKLQEVVLQSKEAEIKRLMECQNRLSMNFLALNDVLLHGSMTCTKLQPFDGLIGNEKMEQNYNKNILKLLPMINIDVDALPDPEFPVPVRLVSDK